MTRPLLLALDPSLRCTGWLIVALDGTRELVAAGAIKTSSNVGKKDLLTLRMRDDVYAAYHLQRELEQVIDTHAGIVQSALENPSGIPHSRYGEKCPKCGRHGAPDAAAWGKMLRAQQAVLSALNPADTGLRPLIVSTFAAKFAATGAKRPKGKKAEVADRVRKSWGEPAWDRVLSGDKAAREAMYDAGAVALVALEDFEVLEVINDHRRQASRTGAQA